ncbi:vitamin K epoxide reductase family protein [Geobacter sp.]|uniref:vitamin K epoxide reductase family protein n=1 Tax=Geobacter sp. TaxID=46610 RepID=UPI001ACE0728|nr:vitamin K epoxide reductase family protein [Geobacter sp.]CAG1007494.1 hypothetical protein ANAEL_03543 [Anaerolineales bacterium]
MSPRISLTSLLLWLATIAGLSLSVISLLKICSACSETGQFSILAFDFGWFGITFFVVLAVALALRRRFHKAERAVTLLLLAAAGAEIRFIWLQKYVIGEWCPICLGIAAVVLVGCISLGMEAMAKKANKGAVMGKRLKRMITAAAVIVAGFTTALLGVRQESAAAGLDPYLGNRQSSTIVYFVSDWFCPVCRKVEPSIAAMYPEIARKAKVGFVDFPIHKETLNFTPYHLQFLAFEKEKYFALRKALSELSLKTKNPSPEEVQAAVAPHGVKLRQLDYADILYGMQSDLSVYRGYGLKGTPSVVVTNSKSKKTKIFVGDREITREAITNAIAEVGR